jgi:serine/threonine protein kinase
MTPQQTIAHYRVTAKIGEGGMGEVWRASDTKLGREVAIKILPEAFARDADRMARFEREAKPRMWSEKKLANLSLGNYDLAPDGKRIVALMPDETTEGQKAQNHVIFLQNFFDELRRRAPTSK